MFGVSQSHWTDSPNPSFPFFSILHYLPPNGSILHREPPTETLEEYHVAHGDGSDRDVGTYTWRVHTSSLISSKLGDGKPFSTFNFIVINNFYCKQTNLSTSFNPFNLCCILETRAFFHGFSSRLPIGSPPPQPKSTALVRRTAAKTTTKQKGYK